ncbi:prolyl endopeptidase-like isoform X2 [Thalassophryne amazonica]|uniref:prolyl endopeptidase-like isoform X2 n=1 Tax=Thalassophryne amazonica TaxID=390379 RepID=UPI0014710176|nr:prolyl endopeptidase-like isoform X2 [Thalassophryne amazonica]
MMSVLSSLLWVSFRFLTASRCVAFSCRTSQLYKLFVPRCYTSSATDTPADYLTSGIEEYKDLQKYFSRRLRATYRKFSSVPDNSMVCGRHHVYVVQFDGIYRMGSRHGESESQQVLDLRQIPAEETKTGVENLPWVIQRVRVSPQEKHLAATVKTCDSEMPKCLIVKLGDGNPDFVDPPHVALTVDKVVSFEWVTDDILFYTTLEGLRCSSVFRLDLTCRRTHSVFEESRPDVFVEVALSRDRHILTINCNSKTSSEVLLIDTTTPNLEPFLVQPRQRDLLYHVEHWRGSLILLANTGPGLEYQVVQASLLEPFMASWVPLFVPGPGAVVKDMEVVGDHCVLFARTQVGELVLTVVPLTHPSEAFTIQLPSWACAVETRKPGLTNQHNVLELLISSPVHPPVPFCLNLKDGLLLARTKDWTSMEKQSGSVISRLEACSQDGTLVPVTLFHTVPVERLKEAPLLVHVYGAYGRDVHMDFCPENTLLLQQGWTLAYCHIRGGGERGLFWHRQARVEGRQRGVDDLRACLHHLFSIGVSSPSLTALTTCSAGAVPVGALCNSHPHMMQAVMLQAPFLNVLEAMENSNLPLTVEEREEWGDPVGNTKHRLAITSYCPLNNITPQRYPSMLLTAYRDDARVPLTGILKYTEKLKKALHTHFTTHPVSGCKPNIVLNVQPGANHLGPEDFELRLEEAGLKLAFLYQELGLDHLRPPRKKRR